MLIPTYLRVFMTSMKYPIVSMGHVRSSYLLYLMKFIYNLENYFLRMVRFSSGVPYTPLKPLALFIFVMPNFNSYLYS